MIPCNLLWAFRSAHAGQLWTQCVRSFLAVGQKYRRDRRCHVLFTPWCPMMEEVPWKKLRIAGRRESGTTSCLALGKRGFVALFLLPQRSRCLLCVE